MIAFKTEESLNEFTSTLMQLRYIGMKQVRVFQILQWILVCGGVVVGMSSCQRDPLKDLTTEDSQVFITNYDRSANFASYQTFSLPDSVVYLTNDRAQTSLTTLEQRFLDQVSQTMTSRGYRRTNTNADLGVAVSRINQRYVGVTSDPYSSYYMNYWGYGGFGSFYPYYPSYYSFYEVSDAYWQVQIVDLRNRNTANNQLNVVWQAEIRGDGIFDETSVNNILTSVFNQSTYLRSNQ